MVRLDIHLEQAGTEVAWWAESDDVPGFTACASSLAELRQLSREALTDVLGGPVGLTENLIGRPLVTVGPMPG